jgi:hypothetical protein
MDEEMAAAVAASEAVRLFTPTEALTELLPPVYRGGVPDEVKKLLVQNYGAGAVIT